MYLDTELNVLLVATGSLQLGALATRIAGRKLFALAMAGASAAVALASTLLIFAEFDAVALEAAVAGVAAFGLARRGESGWLFWPVWLWNFVMVYLLVRLRFFFRLYF